MLDRFFLDDVLMITFSKAVYTVPLKILKTKYKEYLTVQEYKTERIDRMVAETLARDPHYIIEWVRHELSWNELKNDAIEIRNYGQDESELHNEFSFAYFNIQI
jgi:hypothetical protein